MKSKSMRNLRVVVLLVLAVGAKNRHQRDFDQWAINGLRAVA